MKAGRVAAAVALGLVAVLAAVLTAAGAWARATIVDTDGFVAAVSPLGSDPVVTSRIATTATDRTVAAIDQLVQQNTGALAPVLTILLGQLRPTIASTIEGVVTGPTFQPAWDAAARDLHSQLLADLRGQGDTAVAASGNALTIDLALLRDPLTQALSGNRIGELIASNIDLGTVTVPTGIDFDRLRGLVKFSDAWWWLPPLLLLLCGAAAVIVAPARPAALALLGVSMTMAAGFAVAAARSRVDSNVAALSQDDRPIARAVVDALDDDLYRNLGILAGAGLVLGLAGLEWWLLARASGAAATSP